MTTPATVIPNSTAAMGICGIDPDSGDAYAIGLSNAAAITTAGTTTVDTQMGALFGFNVISLGTAMTVAAYDVVGTSSLQLVATQTASALGPFAFPGPQGVAVRYSGNLVVVTGGTMGQVNALWD